MCTRNMEATYLHTITDNQQTTNTFLNKSSHHLSLSDISQKKSCICLHSAAAAKNLDTGDFINLTIQEILTTEAQKFKKPAF